MPRSFVEQAGIIPARAGTRPGRSAARWARRDHPRACGDQLSDDQASVMVHGSSPRVRGPVLREEPRPGNARIIPARAGTSAELFDSLLPVWDHPRACGDQALSLRCASNSMGSSPRVRGPVELLQSVDVLLRIIPARAGTSRPDGGQGDYGRDHPRACGDQRDYGENAYFGLGSSPRVRGPAGRVRPRTCPHGIIPARAGTRRRGVGASRSSRDHPRACGDQRSRMWSLTVWAGSSPRVRGPADRRTRRRAGRRIIPARAGTRPNIAPLDAVGRDHPRACGDQHP